MADDDIDTGVENESGRDSDAGNDPGTDSDAGNDPGRETDTGDALTVLLVEDNAGDARYIEEMLHEIEMIPERTAERGAATADGVTVDPAREVELVHETRLSDSLDVLTARTVDVVLLDLNLPDSTGIETVQTVREHSDVVPVVVLTGIRDRELGIDALRRGAEEYLVKDEINADMLVRSVHHAIERRANQRQLERQRNQLATLNSLNELVNEVSHLAIESSTREELEQLVCDHLADSESYQFAWIGGVDRTQGTVTVRAEAGTDGYLDDISLAVDDEVDQQGPTVRAIHTGETQVARNILENPDYDPWRDLARERGFQSSAAIPIEYEETLYGVLNVYSARPDGFDADERLVVGRLSEVLGHAINAIERKRALMSEEVVELRFRAENVFASVDGQGAPDEPITFDRTVAVSDEEFLEYGTGTVAAIETLETLVDSVEHFDSLDVLGDEEGDGTRRFRLRLTEPPVAATVASYGGRVDAAELSGGDYHVVAHLPTSVDVSRVVDAIRDDHDDITIVAQRHVTRTDEGTPHPVSVVTEELTDKQRRALEAAYFSGFFAWPRDSSGEDVADSLGVSAPTFHQHVRAAEEKLLRTVFEEATGSSTERRVPADEVDEDDGSA